MFCRLCLKRPTFTLKACLLTVPLGMLFVPLQFSAIYELSPAANQRKAQLYQELLEEIHNPGHMHLSQERLNLNAHSLAIAKVLGLKTNGDELSAKGLETGGLVVASNADLDSFEQNADAKGDLWLAEQKAAGRPVQWVE